MLQQVMEAELEEKLDYEKSHHVDRQQKYFEKITETMNKVTHVFHMLVKHSRLFQSVSQSDSGERV